MRQSRGHSSSTRPNQPYLARPLGWAVSRQWIRSASAALEPVARHRPSHLTVVRVSNQPLLSWSHSTAGHLTPRTMTNQLSFSRSHGTAGHLTVVRVRPSLRTSNSWNRQLTVEPGSIRRPALITGTGSRRPTIDLTYRQPFRNTDLVCLRDRRPNAAVLMRAPRTLLYCSKITKSPL